jgi:lipopolysaccharide transport system permease protein
VPYAALLLGLTWLFAALGVYVRDLIQLVGPLVMMTMFLGPVFFPRSAMPEGLQPWLALNPLTIPIEQLRLVLFEGRWPDWSVLAAYSLVAVAIYLFGLWAFASLKKGFADVI